MPLPLTPSRDHRSPYTHGEGLSDLRPPPPSSVFPQRRRCDLAFRNIPTYKLRSNSPSLPPSARPLLLPSPSLGGACMRRPTGGGKLGEWGGGLLVIPLGGLNYDLLYSRGGRGGGKFPAAGVYPPFLMQTSSISFFFRRRWRKHSREVETASKRRN